MANRIAVEFVRAVLLKNPEARTFEDIYDALTWAASTRSFYNLGYKELSMAGVSFSLNSTHKFAGLIAEVEESLRGDLRHAA